MPDRRRNPAVAPITRRTFLQTTIAAGLAAPSLAALSGCVPYEDLTADMLRRHVEALVAISERRRAAGDVLWGRIAGRAGETEAADYVAERLTAYGTVDWQGRAGAIVDRFNPNAAQWWPTRLQLALEGHARSFPTATAATFSAPTPAGGRLGDVVDVDTGGNLDGFDLQGKVALVRSLPRGSVFSHSAQDVVPLLAGRGAVGALVWIDEPRAPGDIAYAKNTGAAASLTWLMLGRDDGLAVRTRLPVRARLHVEGSLLRGWSTQNVIGVLPGNAASTSYVVVMAHLDAFFAGANDNASGVANLLVLARHYAQVPQAQRKRTLVFAGTAGHHNGPGIGANRLETYLKGVDPAFFSKCALVLNAEHLGTQRLDGTAGQNPRSLGVRNGAGPVPRASLLGWFREGFDSYGVRVSPTVSTDAGGDGAFLATSNATVASLIESFFWYHSTYDDLTRLRPEAIANVSKACASVIDRLVL